MKQLFAQVGRVLRSRFFLAALCIVLEFAQLMVVFVLLYQFVWPVTVLGWVFYIGVLLYLINRDDIPECKLPWLLILCFLPVVGAFVYMLLSSNRTSEKEYRRVQKAEQELLPYQSSGELDTLVSLDADAYAQVKYLTGASGLPCYANTKITYYPIGEEFHQALLEDLQKAQRFIFMEYFIVQEGKMWAPLHQILRKKAAQGVKVYFLYDDVGCLGLLPERYYQQLEGEGIHCLPTNKFTPVLSHIHNNRDHRKITVIDGRIGFTGGINLADEYINAIVKHGHWKDTAVRLEGPGVENLTYLFLLTWNSQTKMPLDPGPYLESPTPRFPNQGFCLPFGDGPEPIYLDSIGKNVYLNMIHGARERLYITTPYLICDHELRSALGLAAKKGVDVRIIVPHIPDKWPVHLMTRSNYEALVRGGVRIYEYTPGFIHAKSFVCDGKLGVCGTINLDYRSLVHHFECGVWMYKTACLPDMEQDFLRNLSVSEEITPRRARLRNVSRLLAEVMKIFSPLF